MKKNLQKELSEIQQLVQQKTCSVRTDDDWRNLVAFGPATDRREKLMNQFAALPDERKRQILSKPSQIYQTVRQMEWCTIGDNSRLLKLIDGMQSDAAEELGEQFKSIWYCRDPEVMDCFRRIIDLTDQDQLDAARAEISRGFIKYKSRLFYPVRPTMLSPESSLRGSVWFRDFGNADMES